MRVLVAIDGSSQADIAVDLVAGIAWPDATTIRLVEAVEVSASQLGGPWPSLAVGETDRLDAEMRSAAEQALAERRPRLERPGLTVESSILEGRPASAIVHEARAMDAELVVVGSRGHGIIESMLLGSVSAEVVDHAPAPVLVARGSRIDRVVLAWDGSACAARAATLVRGWPIFRCSDVRVVSVADIGTPWWTGFPEPGSAELMPMLRESAIAVRDERDLRAQSMKARLIAAGLRAEADPREGDPAPQILAAANEAGADLIVMGTHGRTGLARLMLGSVARNVLLHAGCSVLIVRDTPS